MTTNNLTTSLQERLMQSALFVLVITSAIAFNVIAAVITGFIVAGL